MKAIDTFRDLNTGDTFDFLDDDNRMFNSFYDRCRKISFRRYQSLDTGTIYQVGTINVRVHHVESKGAYPLD